MTFTDNEKRIINVLLTDPTINNAKLAICVFMSLSTLNGTLTDLYLKYGIEGNGRAKRAILIDKLSLQVTLSKRIFQSSSIP